MSVTLCLPKRLFYKNIKTVTQNRHSVLQETREEKDEDNEEVQEINEVCEEALTDKKKECDMSTISSA